MNTYEVTVTVTLDAGTPEEAKSLVSDAIWSEPENLVKSLEWDGIQVVGWVDAE